MIRRAAVLTVAALLLAGCTLAPEPVVSPTPTKAEIALPTPAVGVVGSGDLNGMPFDITWDGNDFALTGLAGMPEGTLEVSSAQAVVGECTPGYSLVFGLPFPVPIPLATAEITRDVTFLNSVSLVGEYTNDCYGYPVLSTAPIVWSMKPLYTDLVVVDSGDTGGARGIVTLDGETPVSYQVNQGDVLQEIAARFGLTTDQLVWLNPHRSNQETVYKDETLNLSPSRR